MHDGTRVHELECTQNLVNDVLLVDILQDVSLDHVVQVRIHVLEHEVDIAVILSTNDIQKPYNIQVVMQLLEKHDLTERSLSVRSILECIKNLLQCHTIARLAIH